MSEGVVAILMLVFVFGLLAGGAFFVAWIQERPERKRRAAVADRRYRALARVEQLTVAVQRATDPEEQRRRREELCAAVSELVDRLPDLYHWEITLAEAEALLVAGCGPLVPDKSYSVGANWFSQVIGNAGWGGERTRSGIAAANALRLILEQRLEAISTDDLRRMARIDDLVEVEREVDEYWLSDDPRKLYDATWKEIGRTVIHSVSDIKRVIDVELRRRNAGEPVRPLG
jgi:hypothetical protein